jgi:hypothetical protein
LHSACHPDEASNASGRKDLGQRGASAAGSGFALLLSNENPKACANVATKDRCAISETGTGFACAKLSEVHSSHRVAQVVRMTEGLALLASVDSHVLALLVSVGIVE